MTAANTHTHTHTHTHRASPGCAALTGTPLELRPGPREQRKPGCPVCARPAPPAHGALVLVSSERVEDSRGMEHGERTGLESKISKWKKEPLQETQEIRI